MKENGTKIKQMAKGDTGMLMAIIMKDIGKTIKLMEQDFIPQLMDQVI